MGSSSLGGTLVTQFTLRMPTTMGTLLLLLWILSPLGGQAGLRMLTIKDTPTQWTPLTLSYLGPDDSTILGSPTNTASVRTALNSMYTASLYAQDRLHSSEDIYNNIKVPFFEKLNQTDMDGDGWITIAKNAKDIEYSSLLGIPTAGRPNQGYYNYSMQSSYFGLDCTKPINMIYRDHQNYTTKEFGGIGWSATTFPDAPSMIFNTSVEDRGRGPTDEKSIKAYPGIWNETNPSARTMVFASVAYNPFNSINWATCKITTTYVETQVQCTDRSCYVSAIRKTVLPHKHNNLTIFDLHGWFLASQFTNEFSRSGGPFYGRVVSTTERYIFDPPSAVNSSIGYRAPDMSKLSAEDFSARLAVAINTYWRATILPDVVPGGLEKYLRLPDERLPAVLGEKVPTIPRTSSTSEDPIKKTSHATLHM